MTSDRVDIDDTHKYPLSYKAMALPSNAPIDEYRVRWVQAKLAWLRGQTFRSTRSCNRTDKQRRVVATGTETYILPILTGSFPRELNLLFPFPELFTHLPPLRTGLGMSERLVSHSTPVDLAFLGDSCCRCACRVL